MRVLVTGATGFVGRYLCPLLTERGHQVTAAVREVPVVAISGANRTVAVGGIGPDTDWSEALDGIEGIIHLAARTHVMKDRATDPEGLYRDVNVGGTTGLAAAAINYGILRFVYLSSVKALAERSGKQTLNESMSPAPEDAYGRTKLEAEKALLAIARGTDMKAVILRPPLIYGPGVKANLLKLLKACDKRLPLPLKLIKNKRSLIYLGNLADALICVLEADGLSVETFLVSDGEAVSTPELVRRISDALGRSPRLAPVPVWVLQLAGALTGKTDIIERLTGSLEIDDSNIREQLGWTPPFSMLQGLAQTAAWFNDQESR